MIISLLLALSAAVWPAQSSDPLATFKARVEAYAEIHRRAQRSVPVLPITQDMDQVRRIQNDMRSIIQASRKAQGQGWIVTPAVLRVFRQRVVGSLTVDGIASTMEDIDEHMPPSAPPILVNERLPADMPLGMVPPQVLKVLPPLPRELRWVVLSGALIIWDQPADLVVDIAPGVFDASTYAKPGRMTP